MMALNLLVRLIFSFLIWKFCVFSSSLATSCALDERQWVGWLVCLRSIEQLVRSFQRAQQHLMLYLKTPYHHRLLRKWCALRTPFAKHVLIFNVHRLKAKHTHTHTRWQETVRTIEIAIENNERGLELMVWYRQRNCYVLYDEAAADRATALQFSISLFSLSLSFSFCFVL